SLRPCIRRLERIAVGDHTYVHIFPDFEGGPGASRMADASEKKYQKNFLALRSKVYRFWNDCATRIALIERLIDLCSIGFAAQDCRRRQTAAARISGEYRGADRKDDYLCCKDRAIAGYDFNRNPRKRCVWRIVKIEVFRDHEIDLEWRNENETGVLPLNFNSSAAENCRQLNAGPVRIRVGGRSCRGRKFLAECGHHRPGSDV